MSHSSKVTMNTTNCSKPIVSTVNDQALSTSGTDAIKRTASDDGKSQSKKVMVHHPTGQNNQYSATAPLETKFIRASEMASTTNINIKIEPEEISDQELLQMALMFEKQHPQ